MFLQQKLLKNFSYRVPYLPEKKKINLWNTTTRFSGARMEMFKYFTPSQSNVDPIKITTDALSMVKR